MKEEKKEGWLGCLLGAIQNRKAQSWDSCKRNPGMCIIHVCFLWAASGRGEPQFTVERKRKQKQENVENQRLSQHSHIGVWGIDFLGSTDVISNQTKKKKPNVENPGHRRKQ